MMLEQAVQVGEATRQAAQRSIAAPALSTCEDCERELTVLDTSKRLRAHGQEPLPRAA